MIQALLFDLDGTLYSQRALQRRIIPRLLVGALREGLAPLRAIDANRRALELLRREDRDLDLPLDHYRLAARLAKLDLDQLRRHLDHWYVEAPLPLLGACRRPGLLELLDAAQARGLRLGVFSDYPPHRKLTALGLDGRFEAALSASDAAVRRFKPHPRGLHAVLEQLQVPPQNALYIGDRADVDLPAARAAGLQPVLIRRSDPSCLSVTDFHGLLARLPALLG